MIEIDINNRIHRITRPITSKKELKKEIDDYYDPRKTIGFSRKKRKYVMKYPRRTYWKIFWARRNKKKR